MSCRHLLGCRNSGVTHLTSGCRKPPEVVAVRPANCVAHCRVGYKAALLTSVCRVCRACLLAARQVVAASRICAKLAGRSFAQPSLRRIRLRCVTIPLPALSCVHKSRLAAVVGAASRRTAGCIGAAASIRAHLVWWSCMRSGITCNLDPNVCAKFRRNKRPVLC